MMRSGCGSVETSRGNLILPCYEIYSPRSVQKNLNLLQEMCPQLLDQNPSQKLCCDAEQIKVMHEEFTRWTQFGINRCPSCMHNYQQRFCQLNCATNQEEFLNISKASHVDAGVRVEAVTYHLHRDFVNALWNSCKGVRGLTNDTFALDYLCSSWRHAECTAERWLDFKGLKVENGGEAAFQVNHLLHDTEYIEIDKRFYKPMNAKTFKCSEAPSDHEKACVCEDCEEACPKKPMTDEKANEQVGPIRGQSFSVLGLYIAISAALFLLFLVTCFISFLVRCCRGQ